MHYQPIRLYFSLDFSAQSLIFRILHTILNQVLDQALDKSPHHVEYLPPALSVSGPELSCYLMLVQTRIMFRESRQEIISSSINCKSIRLKSFYMTSVTNQRAYLRNQSEFVKILTCSVSGLISPEVAPPQLQISPSLMIPET